MNLHILQTNIGPQITLGILGTQKTDLWGLPYTRVFFVLRANDWAVTKDFPRAFTEVMGTGLTVCESLSTPVGPGDSVMLFSLDVNGELRNPRSYLKSVARKLTTRVLPITESNDDPYFDTEDPNWDEKFNQFSTDNWQSDQAQIAAERGVSEEED